jgi:hypothetical protein
MLNASTFFPSAVVHQNVFLSLLVNPNIFSSSRHSKTEMNLSSSHPTMKIPLYEENAVSGHPGQGRHVQSPIRRGGIQSGVVAFIARGG